MSLLACGSSHHGQHRPFTRIMFYNVIPKPPCMMIHALTKTKDTIHPPTFFDTFFYSIPVRNLHETTIDNCILAFACKHHAKYYCEMLNKEFTLLDNHKEPKVLCNVESFMLPELSYNSFILGSKLCLICSSFCETQREPVFDLMLFDKPYEQK